MNRHSLFKVQSLVAIVLCTSLSAWGAASLKSASEDEGSSASSSQNTKAKKFCDDFMSNSGKNSSECAKYLIDIVGSSSGEDPAAQKCEQAQNRDSQKQSEYSSAQSQYFEAMNQKLEAIKASEGAKIEAQTEVTNAQTAYNNAITNINLVLPNTTQQIRDQAAKELLKLKQQMIEIGKQIIEADNILRQAQTAIDDAASNMQATCATFAGTKANKKLDDFDKAFAALKGTQNTYVNYSTTNVAGAKNRRNAKRARDAQQAFASAYAACMSGETDKNGGDPGPGPQLLQELKKAQQALPKAQEVYKQTMQLIEMQKQNLMEQMAQNEKSMNTAIQTAMTKAQIDSNNAYTQLQQTIASANGKVAAASLDLSLKGAQGGLFDQQMQMAQGRLNSAMAAANTATGSAAALCNDMGASLMQTQQQLLQSISTGQQKSRK